MSYDLAVWYPDRHLDDDQALARYNRLCNGDIDGLKPHPSIGAFYKELSNIHPEIDDVPEDKSENSILAHGVLNTIVLTVTSQCVVYGHMQITFTILF
jgi:hypothetical protein